MIQHKIPVSVASGFLSTGKTTLADHLMRQRATAHIGFGLPVAEDAEVKAWDTKRTDSPRFATAAAGHTAVPQ